MATETGSADPGSVLRSVRAAKGWTLADVKDRTGLPISTLSKLETGKMGLSYDKLMKLGRGLGVDIAQLLGENENNTIAAPQLLSGRRVITRSGDERILESSGFHYMCHSAELLNRSMHPMVVDLKAQTLDEFGEFVRHAGEEFTYVLEGTLEFHCDLYAPVELSKGDSIYFDSGMGHAYLRVPPGPCIILSVCTNIPETI